jgi:hypothetical protein
MLPSSITTAVKEMQRKSGKWPWPILKYCSKILFDRLRKIIRNSENKVSGCRFKSRTFL